MCFILEEPFQAETGSCGAPPDPARFSRESGLIVRPGYGVVLAFLFSMTVVSLIRRLRDEFTEMPGLGLSEEQVQRLCGVSASTAASALRALVSAGFLRPLEDGSYRRADS